MCVGMQKAGTDFLFDCLNGMDEFRLPLRKEMHHFDERKKLHPGGRQLLLDIANAIREGNYSDDELFSFFAQMEIKHRRIATIVVKAKATNLVAHVRIGFSINHVWN